MFSRLTSSRMCHPSCQNEPGNGRPPHLWRLLHRWGRGSCGRRPPASFLYQNRTSHRSKQKAEILDFTWKTYNRPNFDKAMQVAAINTYKYHQLLFWQYWSLSITIYLKSKCFLREIGGFKETVFIITASHGSFPNPKSFTSSIHSCR